MLNHIKVANTNELKVLKSKYSSKVTKKAIKKKFDATSKEIKEYLKK